MDRKFFVNAKWRGGILVASFLMVIASIIGVTAVSSSTPASASATGCARFGRIYIPGPNVTIPGGQYCFGLSGGGTSVNFTDGSVDTGWIVNYSETVRFYDSTGNNYYTFSGPVHAGYAYGYHFWTTGIHGVARVGRVCGTLMSSGAPVVSACDNIY